MSAMVPLLGEATTAPAAGKDHDEAFRLGDAQGLPDRVAGDAEVLRQPVLGQPFTGQVVAVDDGGAQGGEDLIA